MDRCPSCHHSRWIYHRSVPFTAFVSSLTGWYPFECLSCGWRGWRPSHASPAASPGRRLAEFAARGRRHVERASSRIRDAGSTWVERLRAQVRGSGLMWAGVWIIPGFVLGILLSVLLLSPEPPLSDSERVLASRRSSTLRSPSPALALDETAQTARAVQPNEPPIAPTPIEGPRTDVPPAPAATSGSLPPPAARTPAPGASASPRAKAARTAPGSLRYRGSLVIESDPEGARVSLNGRLVGSTPILLEDLPAGSCVVRVEADGYEPWSTAARVVAHRENRVSATLQRESHNQP